MAIRRRRPASKAPTGPTSRVHVVDSVGQWQNLLSKAAASNRVVVVQFFQVRSEGLAMCHLVLTSAHGTKSAPV